MKPRRQSSRQNRFPLVRTCAPAAMKALLRLLTVALPAGRVVFSAEPAADFTDAFARGKISLDARLRYERVEQTDLRDAEALTLRTRRGFTTAPWLGFKAAAEAEHIVAGTGLGEEIDAQLARKFGRPITGLVKFADFRRDSLAYPNVQKICAQVDCAY